MRLTCIMLLAILGGQAMAQLTRDDHAVISAACSAIQREKDFKMMLGRGQGLVLIDTTPEKLGMLRVEQMQADLAPRQVRQDLLEALWERNQDDRGWLGKQASYKGLKVPKGTQIGPMPKTDKKMTRPSQAFASHYPKARGFFQPYLPAYSSDESYAIVRGLAGPSAHGSTATVLLQRSGSKWVVLWTRIAFYA